MPRKKRIPVEFPIHLPRKLKEDFEHCMVSNPPDFKYNIDNFLFLLQLPAYRLRVSGNDENLNGFVTIRKKTLKPYCPEYRKYLNYLVENKLLEERKSYHVGLSSGSLRYPLHYYSGDLVKTTITRRALVKRLTNSTNPFAEKYADLNLSKWFNDKLTVDYEIAKSRLYDLCDMRYNSKKRRPKNLKERKKLVISRNSKLSKWFKLNKTELKNANSVKLFANMITLERLNDGDFGPLRFDKTSGRFHSVLTLLKKELRAYVKYDNQGLVCIDIANSQPFLLTALFKITEMEFDIIKILKKYNPKYGPQTYTDKHITKQVKSAKEAERELQEAKSIDNQTNKQERNIIYNNRDIKDKILINNEDTDKATNMVPIMYLWNENDELRHLHELLTSIGLYPEAEKYISLVTAGQFYNYLASEVEFDSLLTFEERKEKVKKSVLAAMYGRPAKLTKGKADFAKLFPRIHELICEINLNDGLDDAHRTLPILLQSIESDIVFDKCYRRITQERPDLQIFTIHDSIVTTVGNEEYIKQVMSEEITNYVGYTPYLRVEYWQ